MELVASVIVLVLVMTLSTTIVKIGAVMLRMTGLDEVSSSFQALSAFTGTGFTTQETENIMRHEKRRKIVRWLIVLGNVGMAVAIASLLNMVYRIKTDSLEGMSSYIAIALICILYIYVLMNKRFNRWLDKLIRKRLSLITNLQADEFEHMLAISEGVGVIGLDVNESHPIINKTLRELALPRFGILVLAVRRGKFIISTPGADFIVRSDDRIICFGHRKQMRVLLEGDYGEDDEERSLTTIFEKHRSSGNLPSSSEEENPPQVRTPSGKIVIHYRSEDSERHEKEAPEKDEV